MMYQRYFTPSHNIMCIIRFVFSVSFIMISTSACLRSSSQPIESTSGIPSVVESTTPVPIKTSIPDTATTHPATKTTSPTLAKTQQATKTLPLTTITPKVIKPTAIPYKTSTVSIVDLPFILLMYVADPGVYLLDFDTGEIIPIPFNEEYQPYDIIAWSENDCSLIVKTNGENSPFNTISRMDLQGNIDEILITREKLGDIRPPRNVVLSPREEWIAYRASSGKPLGGFDVIHEIEAIDVISAMGDKGSYQLTEGNGGRDVSWSPDGSRLAFGDYDENGIHQLYVSRLDGSERIQLTQFDDPTAEVVDVQWSPGGNKISFKYDRYGNITPEKPRKSDLVILTISNPDYPKIIAEEIYIFYFTWWVDEYTLVAYGETEHEDFTKGSDMAFFWVDGTSGRIVDILWDYDTPGGWIALPELIENRYLGFFTDGSFYIYDANTRTFEQKVIFEMGRNIGEWIAPPVSILEDGLCPYP